MNALLAALRARPARAYALLVWTFASLLMALWPVAVGDTDLWFYLTAGRRLFETGDIPAETFASFLEPRPWDNYTWLFSALVYGVHSALGYGGLVALRGVAFAALGCLLLGLLWRDPSRRPAALRAAAFALALCVLAERCKLVRPHGLEYLLLAAFLHILETAPERQSWLPGLALAWANLHGISYPAMALILAAYALERRVTTRTWGLCLAGLLASPLGWRTFALPCIRLAEAGPFMQELVPPGLGDLASLQILSGTLTRRSAFTLLLALAATSLLAQGRGVRRAHAVLFAGGLALLSRGNRFMAEAALLWLPLLGEPWPAATARLDARPWLRRLGWAAAACLPPALLWDMFGTRPAYPWSPRQLPVGVAAFLEKGPGGRVLNYPTQGAYLEWRLSPRYLIHSDMNALHAFTPEDTYEAAAAFTDPTALANALERYAPDFIAAPRYLPGFAPLIARHPRYVPVFFDEVAVLYADGSRHAGLAREWGLPFSPYSLPGLYPSPESTSPGRLPSWLVRMLAIDRYGMTIRVLSGSWLLAGDDPAGSLVTAGEIIAAFPDQPVGHLLQGDSLRALGRPREALSAYRRARGLSDDEGRRLAERKLAAAEAARGGWGKAYRHLRRGVAKDATDLGREGLFRLATAALRAGEEREAQRLFERLYRHHTPAGSDLAAARSEDARRWGGALPY